MHSAAQGDDKIDKGANSWDRDRSICVQNAKAAGTAASADEIEDEEKEF